MTQEELSPTPKIREEIVAAFAAYVGAHLKLRKLDLNSPLIPRIYVETALEVHTQLQDPSIKAPVEQLEPVRSLILQATPEEFSALRAQGLLLSAARLRIMNDGLHTDPDAMVALRVFDDNLRRGLPVSFPRALQAGIRRG